MAQLLRLHAPNAGGIGSIPGKGRSHMLNGAAKKKKKKKKTTPKIFMYPFSIRLTSASVGYNIILKVLRYTWKISGID